MKGTWLFGLLVLLGFLLAACSASNSDDAKTRTESSANDIAIDSEAEEMDAEENAVTDEKMEDMPEIRKIIHRAFLYLQVNDFEEAQKNIEKKVGKYEGYIVESTVYHDEEELANGNMTIRIPATNFQDFLADTEKEATNMIERNVTGEDVTEQYVDLEARLTSKRVVEERLLRFMEEAEKTDDLLKISSDLAVVQEEIEQLVGKINFLENQTAYSTVELNLAEERVILPDIGTKGFDTWNKTKKQFFTSINFLLAFGSGLIVFFVGNFPVILIVLAIGTSIYFFIRLKITPKK